MEGSLGDLFFLLDFHIVAALNPFIVPYGLKDRQFSLPLML
jgi:hypothetical protein